MLQESTEHNGDMMEFKEWEEGSDNTTTFRPVRVFRTNQKPRWKR